MCITAQNSEYAIPSFSAFIGLVILDKLAQTMQNAPIKVNTENGQLKIKKVQAIPVEGNYTNIDQLFTSFLKIALPAVAMAGAKGMSEYPDHKKTFEALAWTSAALWPLVTKYEDYRDLKRAKRQFDGIYNREIQSLNQDDLDKIAGKSNLQAIALTIAAFGSQYIKLSLKDTIGKEPTANILINMATAVLAVKAGSYMNFQGNPLFELEAKKNKLHQIAQSVVLKEGEHDSVRTIKLNDGKSQTKFPIVPQMGSCFKGLAFNLDPRLVENLSDILKASMSAAATKMYFDYPPGISIFTTGCALITSMCIDQHVKESMAATLARIIESIDPEAWQDNNFTTEVIDAASEAYKAKEADRNKDDIIKATMSLVRCIGSGAKAVICCPVKTCCTKRKGRNAGGGNDQHQNPLMEGDGAGAGALDARL